jgi:lipopolysaccharide/colanic/teichoic acid biosynthesis glycosyltransferase
MTTNDLSNELSNELSKDLADEPSSDLASDGSGEFADAVKELESIAGRGSGAVGLCSSASHPKLEAKLRRKYSVIRRFDGIPATDPQVDLLLVDEPCFGGPGHPIPSWVLDSGDVRVLTDDDPNPLRHPIPLLGRWAKRTLDLVAASGGLLVLSIPLAIGALLVFLDTGRPILHRGRRVGEGGRTFEALKLRTMFVDNDPAAHQAYVEGLMKGTAGKQDGMYRLASDPRITRSGGPLRKYAIDEVPQLWNVIQGDMSLLGPRPPMDREALVYSGRAWRRLRVKPGVTGLWQVEAHGEVGFDEMVELDVRYWKTWSFLNDVKLLLRTPMVVLASRGFR